jgi:hypothetical protein
LDKVKSEICLSVFNNNFIIALYNAADLSMLNDLKRLKTNKQAKAQAKAKAKAEKQQTKKQKNLSVVGKCFVTPLGAKPLTFD